MNNQSQMQLKSFLDISLNSSFNLQMSQTERESAHEELKEKSLGQLSQQLSLVMERLTLRLQDYFKGESEILHKMAQERERNQYLEAELSSREDRIRPVVSPQPNRNNESPVSENDLAATEQFINELESQLSQAR